MNLRSKLQTSAFSFLVLLLFTFSCKVDAAARLEATVIAERGAVSVERSGSAQFQALSTQDSLFLGDRVKTSAESDVDILFGDGSQVKVGASSEVRISPSLTTLRSESLFTAVLGVVWAHLRPDSRIVTPSANVIVRGTELTLDVAADGTTQLTVLNGDVTFFNEHGSVDVTDDEQSTAAPGAAPTPPIVVDPTGLIAWTADIVSLPLVYETPQLAVLSAQLRNAHGGVSPLDADLAAAPTTASGWDALGDARRVVGDAAGADDAYVAATNRDPADIDGHAGLALTQVSRGRVDDARAALAPIANSSQGRAVLGLIDLETGNISAANVDLKSAVSLDPRNYSALSLLALAELQSGDLAGADISARQSAAVAPSSPDTLGTLSIVLFFEGKNREALTASKLAVKADPQSSLALLAAGRASMVSGQYDKARVDFEKALAYSPDLWILHQELGTVYDSMNDPHKAIEEFQLALKLDPASVDATIGLGKAEQDSGHYSEAASAYQLAVSLAPEDAQARYYYASYLVDRGDQEGALAQINALTGMHANFGLLYARLAEIYLYKQKLSLAQGYALKAVKLLPGSAIAHYELGRVYLEEERSYQAEHEFRLATVLDSSLAAARYALGLVQEKTESGLLNSFNSIFDSDVVGSPASSSSLNNLESPGAAERVQAAIMDPTAVRAATRSYGNTEIDGDIGNRETHDAAGSYLTDTDGGTGVMGISGETQFQHGIRQNDDQTLNTADFVAGHKSQGSSVGYTILANYEQENEGPDSGTASNPYGAIERDNSQDLRLISGLSIPTGANGRLLALVQGSDYLFGQRPLVDSSNPLYVTAHIDLDSFDGELRWDEKLTPANDFTAGLSYGNRHRVGQTAQNLEPIVPVADFEVWSQSKPVQAYLRDSVDSGGRWSGVAELQFIQEYPTGATSSSLPALISNESDGLSKSVVAPYGILAYKPDSTSVLRLRYQQIAASFQDFSLLAPTDDFLISYANLPQSLEADDSLIATGVSTEVEWDKTLCSGSFLSLGGFRQNLKGPDQANSASNDTGPFTSVNLEGFQVSYQAALSNYLTYFLLGEFSNQEDTSIPQRIPYIPNFTGIGTLQYLNPAGFYGQIAEYYQGDRTADPPDPPQLGAFGVLDLRVGKRVGLRSNVYLEINNVLDKQYDSFGLPQPGTEALVGVSERY